MRKELIYLTDITLHMRGFRQTLNFAKVAQKGRMYSPLSRDYVKNIKIADSGNDHQKFAFQIDLPKDLREKIKKGEAELMIPEGGLLIFPGKDVVEYLKSEEKKKWRELIHKNRNHTWHVDKK